MAVFFETKQMYLKPSLLEKESAQEYETVVQIEVEDDKVEVKIIE